jgi:protein-tyrosine phosphatase
LLPFVDIHVHLLAGLDDGPANPEDALEMCHMALADGTGHAAALAHQGEGWPDNDPERILAAVEILRQQLHAAQLPLKITPFAEVMVNLDIEDNFDAGNYLTLNNQGKFILLEFPPNIGLDVRPIAFSFLERKIQPIIAHIERYQQLFFDEEALSQLARAGCILQVNASTLADPQDRYLENRLKDYCQRNLIHVVGSDGHSPRRRHPRMRGAWDQIAKWAGENTADRLCSTHASQLLGGVLWRSPPVLEGKKKSWFGKLFHAG